MNILQAIQSILIIVLIATFAYVAYQAYKHPAEFAVNATKFSAKVLTNLRTGIDTAIDTGFDQTLGTVPVIGKNLSALGKAAVYLPAMPILKPVDAGIALASGDPGKAWDVIKSTPADAYHKIADIFSF